MQEKIWHSPTWASTHLKQSIELYAYGHAPEPPLLFVGGIHGDEPEGVALAEVFLKWLQEQIQFEKKLQNWVLIPCLNKDGFSQNQRTNAQGVDLNRNFPSPHWSPQFEKNRYFPGNFAGSEPETQALLRAIEVYKPKLILHFHSWEPCIVYTGAPGKESAEILAAHTPFPTKEDIGYPTPGSLGEYGWTVFKTPVICIEAPEKESTENIWKLFGPGLQKLVRRA